MRRPCFRFFVTAGMLLGRAGDLFAGSIGDAFTYQGRLKDGGTEVTGVCAFEFRLFDALTGGTQVAPPVNLTNVPVTEGLFTVNLDFGVGVFDGDPRFLEIAVGCPGDGDGMTTLTPRQVLLAVPYAQVSRDALRALGLGLPLAVTVNTPQDALFITNQGGNALVGESVNDFGVRGVSTENAGVKGVSVNHVGVLGESTGTPVEPGAGVAGISAFGFAGFFQITNENNGFPAVQATTNSRGINGHAISGSTVDNAAGSAGAFTNFNAAGTAPTLLVLNNGIGPTIQARAFNAASTGPVVQATALGTGQAGFFETRGGTLSTTPTLFSHNQELGAAGSFLIDDGAGGPSGNGSPAVEAITRGIGPVGYFEAFSSGSVLPRGAIEVKTANIGPAGMFEVAVTPPESNTSDALSVKTNAVGRAGLFEINNNNPNPPSANSANALEARTNGLGRAAFFQINVQPPVVNTDAALEAHTNGIGEAGRFQITNANSPAAALLAQTQGKGSAAVIESLLAGSTNVPALQVSSMSTDQGVAIFTQNSPANVADAVAVDVTSARHALFVTQTGSGESAHFVNNPGNANNCVYIENEHPAGRALVVQNLLGTGSGAPPGLALQVNGQTELNGSVSVAAGLNVLSGELCAETVCAAVKNFHIDHPLDPANRYMYHACVESNEYKTVYDGSVVTDADGLATIQLPDWFEALNTEFRYQLTVLGQFAQAIVAEKIRDNRFVVRTDKPGVEVCWQVTGVRHDAYAKAHPLRVEVDKPAEERGRYLHSEAHGQLDGLSIHNQARGCGSRIIAQSGTSETELTDVPGVERPQLFNEPIQRR